MLTPMNRTPRRLPRSRREEPSANFPTEESTLTSTLWQKFSPRPDDKTLLADFDVDLKHPN